MFSKKITPDTTELLELELSERIKDLTDAKSAFRRARERRDDAAAALEESSNSAALAQQVRDIELELEERRVFVDSCSDQTKRAERALDMAHTKPVREANAKSLNEAADALERSFAPLRLALAQTVGALDRAGFPDVALATPGPALFATMVHNANHALAASDGTGFVEALRDYAAKMIAGDVPARMRQNLADEMAELRKSA
jgi:hypothetical protein